MSAIGNAKPVQYIPGVTPPPQSVSPVGNTNQMPAQISQGNQPGQGSYPYSEDVFTGQYQQFKSLYQNFDKDISKFSPFYGKMGSAQSQTDIGMGNAPQFTQGNTGMPQQGNNGQIPPIPQSALSPTGQIPQSNGQLPPIPQSALPPSNQAAQGNGQLPQIPESQIPNTPQVVNPQSNTQVPATLQSVPQQSGNIVPKKNPPSGPVMTNLQQKLQEEASQIQTPQKAIESIAGHAMLARQERTMANDIAWGARYYANQAADAADKLNKNKKNMSPAQVQSQLRTIESLKIKSISLLNDAKKRAINNYNESLKATMLYNNFFTENGKFASAMTPNDRQFVESELDKSWATWSGGFDKEWNGQTVKADDSVNVVDKAAQEIASYIDKIDQISASLSK